MRSLLKNGAGRVLVPAVIPRLSSDAARGVVDVTARTPQDDSENNAKLKRFTDSAQRGKEQAFAMPWPDHTHIHTRFG